MNSSGRKMRSLIIAIWSTQVPSFIQLRSSIRIDCWLCRLKSNSHRWKLLGRAWSQVYLGGGLGATVMIFQSRPKLFSQEAGRNWIVPPEFVTVSWRCSINLSVLMTTEFIELSCPSLMFQAQILYFCSQSHGALIISRQEYWSGVPLPSPEINTMRENILGACNFYFQWPVTVSGIQE